MEHQSNVAYGNKYQNGYLGRDLSGTGVGLNWDFIIIHESGHEWFANNITAKDRGLICGFMKVSPTIPRLFSPKIYGQKSADIYVSRDQEIDRQ